MEQIMNEQFLKLDGSITVKEASDSVKSITNKEIKNSSYFNVLVTEAFWQYLNENDIVNCEPINLRQSSKILSDFEVTDIQLPNLSIYVRAVYDEDILFIPKKQFENKITPDYYLFVKIDEELKQGKVLGCVSPDAINKKNDNGKYYFVNKSFLKPFDYLISLIKNSAVKEQYVVSDKTEETLEKLIMLYLDNDIDNVKTDKLVDYLKNSSVAREKLIEFENFERLSYMAINDFKDLNIEDNDFSRYIKNLFPADDFSKFENNDEMTSEIEDNSPAGGGIFVDDDLVDDSAKEPNGDSELKDSTELLKDEFDVFDKEDNSEDLSQEIDKLDFNEENLISDEITNGEAISVSENFPELKEFTTDIEETPAEDLIIDDSGKENDISEFDNGIVDNKIEDDAFLDAGDIDSENESVIIPEDLELNILDNVNDISNGLDTETVIGLTEDVLYESNSEEKEDDKNENISGTESDFEENDLSEMNFVTDSDVDKVIAEANPIVDEAPVIQFEENIDNKSVTVDINPPQGEYDDLSILKEENSAETGSEISAPPVVAKSSFLDDEEDTGIINFDSDVDYRNDEQVQMSEGSGQSDEEFLEVESNLNEIYDENKSEVIEENVENKAEDANEAGTDFAFATEKGFSLTDNMKKGIFAGLVLLCIVGVGAWYFLFHGKAGNISVADTDDFNETEISDINNTMNLTPDDGQGQIDVSAQENVNGADNNVVANVQIPAQKNDDLKLNNASEQITIQKIKKDFSQPDTYLTVSKIVWDVPEYLTYNDDFNNYLQTIGSSLKLNLSSDLLLINENPILNNLKLKISLKSGGKILSTDIIQGCGVQAIDDLVLQSVKNTINILKPPANSIETADEDLYLTICL